MALRKYLASFDIGFQDYHQIYRVEYLFFWNFTSQDENISAAKTKAILTSWLITTTFLDREQFLVRTLENIQVYAKILTQSQIRVRQWQLAINQNIVVHNLQAAVDKSDVIWVDLNKELTVRGHILENRRTESPQQQQNIALVSQISILVDYEPTELLVDCRLEWQCARIAVHG